MDILSAIGLAIPAGLNAYIPLLGLALAQRFNIIHLPEPFAMLGEWWAIALIAVLLVVEVLADKFPAVDHANDAIQSFVRPAAGAIVAVAASGKAGENYPIAMIFLGIVVAGSVHAVKASARPVINVGTAGLGAPVASTVEDVFAALATAAAILLPWLVGGVIVIVLVAAVWVWRRRARRKAAATPES